jgi:alpha-tubulin suppressor-like RCC1 family protein
VDVTANGDIYTWRNNDLRELGIEDSDRRITLVKLLSMIEFQAKRS